MLSINNLNVIVQLKRGWRYVIREDKALSLKIEQNINLLVARYDSLNPGSFRTGSVTVELGNNKGEWKPQEVDFFNNLMQKDTSVTDKAMTLMYHNMRNQLFGDGNKRTAILVANKLMIDHGAGLINVPLDKRDVWNNLISKYYLSGDMKTLKDWTYVNGIQGVTFDHKQNLPKPNINPEDYE